MEGPEPKKRKIHKPPPRRNTAPSPASKAPKDANPTGSSRVLGAQTTDIASFRIQQDKIAAVAQAQQDGCTGNYKKFDSWYGNFLVPVVPSRAELNG